MPAVTERLLARWGRCIGEEAEPPLFLALSGPLGAGKSVLARSVARGAGVEGPVPSPTFNLLFRYPATRGREVVHVDLYRLSGPGDLGELGWDELGAEHEIVLVEWPERAGHRLPPDRWDVALRPVPRRPGLREIEAVPVGRPNPLPPFPAAKDAGSAPAP